MTHRGKGREENEEEEEEKEDEQLSGVLLHHTLDTKISPSESRYK